jgi:hypothetical protein
MFNKKVMSLLVIFSFIAFTGLNACQKQEPAEVPTDVQQAPVNAPENVDLDIDTREVIDNAEATEVVPEVSPDNTMAVPANEATAPVNEAAVPANETTGEMPAEEKQAE